MNYARTPAQNANHSSGSGVHFTYTNAFRVNDRIFVTTFGAGDSTHVKRDEAALAVWTAAAPDAEIVPIDSYDIIWASGALHCIVMQVPRYTDSVPSACATSPAGGELLVPGAPHEITWTAADDGEVSAVDLYYSVDGGLTYPPAQQIAATTPGIGAPTEPGSPDRALSRATLSRATEASATGSRAVSAR